MFSDIAKISTKYSKTTYTAMVKKTSDKFKRLFISDGSVHFEHVIEFLTPCKHKLSFSLKST